MSGADRHFSTSCREPPVYVMRQLPWSLGSRLRKLEEWGVVERRRYSERPPHSCGAEFHPLTVCAACREPYRAGDLTVVGGTPPVEATM